MSKNPRYGLIVLLCLALTAVFVSPSSAQLRGKALYEKLTKDRTLVKSEGLSRVTWTPCGSSYYYYDEEGKSSETTEF